MSATRWSVRFASTQRRAQNLSERYRKLEYTARRPESPSVRPARPTPDTIAGLEIPQEPRPPADDECCMSGCAVCVYDVYEAALEAYKESVATLRAALAARDIPESEWPVHIPARKSKGVVMDAFEELERALRDKSVS